MQFNFEARAKEQRLCNKHDGYTSLMFMRPDSTEHWTGCPKCQDEIEQEKRQHERIQDEIEYKKRFITRLFNQAAIPPRFVDNSFDNYNIDTTEQQVAKNTMMEFAQNIKDNLKFGRNAILAGNPGNGKTHLSVATGRVAINEGYTVLFTTVANMIDRINEAGWNKATTIDNYAIPDLLILDEVANHFNSEEQKNLFKVLNCRYEQIKSTIIQTNLSMDELKAVLGDRIIDRLRQNNCVVLYFTWESYRK